MNCKNDLPDYSTQRNELLKMYEKRHLEATTFLSTSHGGKNVKLKKYTTRWNVISNYRKDRNGRK